jgi:hypothetical protein
MGVKIQQHLGQQQKMKKIKLTKNKNTTTNQKQVGVRGQRQDMRCNRQGCGVA